MNRRDLLNPNQIEVYNQIKDLYNQLDDGFQQQLFRSVPFGDVLVDRWERAKKMGFGEGSSVYDSSLIIGKVLIGKNVWVGPFTILDGSGVLKIGDNCTISSGVHLYSHDNVKRTLSGGQLPIENSELRIGSNTYIAPNCVITKGVEIGNHCLIAAGSFVNSNFEDFSIAAGTPAKKIGKVSIVNGEIELIYYKNRK